MLKLTLLLSFDLKKRGKNISKSVMGENFLALVNTHDGDDVCENVAQIGLQDVRSCGLL